MATASTLTSRPAKLRIFCKPKLQSKLNFVDTVTIAESKRNLHFYECQWMTVETSYCALYHEFSESHDLDISYGTFIGLKPFYIRGITCSDIEMCCCKPHLHARWAINALLVKFKSPI